MSTSTIYIIGAVVLLAIFVVIARLAVRWLFKLTMMGVILIAIVGGAVFWWWTNTLNPKPQRTTPRPSPTRRTNR